MSWLKDILDENRRVVNSWPAWKKGAVMTRKEELEARARDYASLFVISGAEPAATKNLAWMLMEVEREVWEKAITILDGGRFLADSSMERTWADNVIKVLRTQQQELI